MKSIDVLAPDCKTMSVFATAMKTSTGMRYDLTPAEREWLAACGDREQEALGCIRLALVHAFGETEWLNDLLDDQVIYHAKMYDDQYEGKENVSGFFSFLIDQVRDPENNQSTLVELAHMPDGTPCGLVVLRRGYWERGVGSPRWWTNFTCTDDGIVIALTGGYDPSVLSLERSGLYPGITSDELRERSRYLPEPLPRDESMTMFLAGFRGSRELKEAEIKVSRALAGFPGSSLVIFDKLNLDDPEFKSELFKRSIISLPHLAIIKGDNFVFGLNGPLDEETLSKELSLRFLPGQWATTAPANLCQKCLKIYRALHHKPGSTHMCGLTPIATLIWGDEHPDGKPQAVGHSLQCKDWILNLQMARNYLWENGSIAEEHETFWSEAQRLLPEWPGFKRLSLSSAEMDSYRSCLGELENIETMMAENYNTEFHYRCTGPGFVVKGFVCRPDGEKS